MIKCVNVLYGLRIENDGTCKHCCMQINSYNKDKRITTDSFSDIINNSSLIKIKNDLDNNIKHTACQRCWDEESIGKISKRLRDNKKFSHLLENNYEGVRLFDISMGTTCNIKCRTCGPFNSSMWVQEWKDADYFKFSDSQYKNFLFRFNHAFDDDSKFWDEFIQNLKNVEHIDFYGGEPFLVKKQWEVMKYAVDNDFAKNITIHYNTNGTIWDENKFNILKEFKKIDIDFSIDGIYEQFEYIRYPASWNTVLNNLTKVLEISKTNDKFHCSICCTVSNFNIYYIDEIMKFFTKYTNNLYLNLLYGPENQCIKNLPTEIKKIVNNKLTSLVKSDYAGYYFFKSTLDFMNSQEYKKSEWDLFLKKTAWHDDYRDQKFQEIFPEFYKILKEHNYEFIMEK